MVLDDQASRTQAIDPNQSVIVQAPAGSGKTELLTQRFLKLLTCVEQPEQIIALTFTKKAAHEMKQRVLLTLERVQDPKTCSLLRPQTRDLALMVLERNQIKSWNLQQQPHRLNIMTLDALCQYLLKSAPTLLESDIEPYPERLYAEAAHQCFNYIVKDASLRPQLLALLRHLDNQQDKLIYLWIDLLKIRDQWLGLLGHGQSRERMEHTLNLLREEALERLKLSFPQHLKASFLDLIHQFSNLATAPAWCAELRSFHDFDDLSITQARALAQLCLTSQKTIRKKLDHHVGLKKEAVALQVFQELKQTSESMFAQLSETDGFLKALIDVSLCPESSYDEQQWEILQALFQLLMYLVAHLTCVFQEAGRVDFIEVAMQAMQALGDEDAPSEIALWLDQQVRHILIDEFQDTSVSQFKLIERFIQGWDPDDGRTLMIVGDPMQSIYRFRQADVGLFLKVQHDGIGPRTLKCLSLTSNFRSDPCLVNWVNDDCGPAFPKHEDRDLGSIVFHASHAAREHQEDAYVRALSMTSSRQEAIWISEQIQQLLIDHPQDSIAILVRSRRQLEQIIPQFRAMAIGFEGVELFSLADEAHVRDLFTLTQVLLMPCERLPWFCFLRSPYVGLSLEDLHQFSLNAQSSTFLLSVAEVLKLTCISAHGQERLRYVHAVIEQAMLCKDQDFLSSWILKTHQALMHGHAPSSEQWQDFENYFNLIDQWNQSQLLFDWPMFEQAFRRMYASSLSQSRLKIMTIHQSKGLEFDTVFLPCLSSKSRPNEARLMRWMNILDAQGQPSWIISPLKSIEESHDPLYDFLGSVETEKDHFERIRLLYVAVTRAKKRLILTDGQEQAASRSFRSLLEHVKFEVLPATEHDMLNQEAKFTFRFEQAWYASPKHDRAGGAANEYPLLTLNETHSATLGTLVHRWIQLICEFKWSTLIDLPWTQIQKECEFMGWADDETQQAMVLMQRWFTHLMTTDRGRWTIAAYAQAVSEFAFMVKESSYTATYVVDRMFVDQGKRWVVDFKTGAHHDASEEQHRFQVTRYARYLSQHFQEPIHCGVYYLSNNDWIEWVERCDEKINW